MIDLRKAQRCLLAGALVVLLAACSGGPPVAPGDPGGSGGPAAPSDRQPAARPRIGTWTGLADLPQPRTELSATVLDGALYVAGGLVAGPSEPVYRYEPAADAWSHLAPLPAPRHHAPLASHDGRVYVIGGFDLRASDVSPFGTPTDTLFVYDVARDAWREGPPLPEPVAAHAVATTEDGTIHVLGGLSRRSVPARAEHLAFDTTTGTWSSLPPMPSSREHLGAAYLDGVIYAAAGRTGGEGVAFEAYDVASGEWTVLPDMPTARSGVGVVAFAGQVYVLGGEGPSGTFDHVERFDPATGAWQEVTPLPSARHGLGTVALSDGILVVGGGPTVGLSYSASTALWRP